MNEELVKKCNKCGIEKPHSQFSRSSNLRKTDKFGLLSRCKKCRAIQNLEWHKNNPAKSSANRKAFHQRNIDDQRAKARQWNSDHKEHCREKYKEWSAGNRAHLTNRQRHRQCSKSMATPDWLTPIQLAQISEFYEIAKARSVQLGIEHHVDHIVPLKHDFVAGLHVPWNLQVLTAFENVSKKNRFGVNA